MNTTPDNPSKMRIEYVEVNLSQVIQYFVNGYKLHDGNIVNHDAYIDTAKSKVVLKLFVETPTN